MAAISARLDPLEGAAALTPHKRSMCEVVPEDDTLRDLSSSSATTTDSAVSSTGDPNSRRSSSGAGLFGGEIRPRRSTINSRMPIARPKPLRMGMPNPEDISWRKVSNADSQFVDSNDSDDDLDQPALYSRRMSVDERTLRAANYAILRKNLDRSFEIVGAFNRHQTSAYRSYLQSLVAYDIAPTHGILFTIDAQLSVRKTIHAMCVQSMSHRAAMIQYSDGTYNIFTLSDLLLCLQKRTTDPDLGNQPVAYYFDKVQNGKRLVTASSEITVWDLARQFRINHVHRIPVVEVRGLLRTNELFCLLSLRPIFSEISKLVQTKCCLRPNLTKLTVSTPGLGKWAELATLSEGVLCAEAVDVVLEKRVSCLPLVDADQAITAVFCKYDVLAAVAEKGESGIDEIMQIPVTKLVDPRNMDMLIPADTTIFDAIHQLIHTEHQCLFVTDPQRKLLGVVSYADIMDYLVRAEKGQTEEGNQ